MTEVSLLQLLLLHVALTCLIFLLVRKSKNTMQALSEAVVVFCVPVCGFLILTVFHLCDYVFRFSQGRKIQDSHDDNMTSMNTVRFANDIIPLRDAFLLDDDLQKRQFFTEAIKQDVISNEGILQMAIRDQDRETAYYAVSMLTARLEKLEEKLFKAENAYLMADDEGKIPALRKYVALLKNYLSHERFFDHVTFHKRQERYTELLEKMTEWCPEEKEYYEELFQQLLRKKAFDAAEKLCESFREKFPQDEDSYIMYISLYRKMYDKVRMQQEIQKLKASPLKLSKNALQLIRYWDRKVKNE